MAHDRQTVCMTGRPSHMTYRPWQMTGRLLCDLEASCNRQTFMHDIQTMANDRQTYATKLMAFYWIQSAYNLSDMVSDLEACEMSNQ